MVPKQMPREKKACVTALYHTWTTETILGMLHEAAVLFSGFNNVPL